MGGGGFLSDGCLVGRGGSVHVGWLWGAGSPVDEQVEHVSAGPFLGGGPVGGIGTGKVLRSLSRHTGGLFLFVFVGRSEAY